MRGGGGGGGGEGRGPGFCAIDVRVNLRSTTGFIPETIFHIFLHGKTSAHRNTHFRELEFSRSF